MKITIVLILTMTAAWLAGGFIAGNNMFLAAPTGSPIMRGDIQLPHQPSQTLYSAQSSVYPVFCMARKNKAVPPLLPTSKGNSNKGNSKVGHIAQPAKWAGNDFVLLFTGNWQGHLEPCGCTDVQLGGIDRRSETIKRIAPDKHSRLMVDSGPLITGGNRQSKLKLDVLIRSMAHLGYDGISLTPRELMFMQNSDTSLNKRPPVIASNMSARARKEFHTIAVLHKKLTLRGASLNCVVITLIDPSQVRDAYTKQKMQLSAPILTLKNIVQDEGFDTNKKTPGNTLVIVLLPNAGMQLLQRVQNIAAVDIVVTRGAADEPEKFPFHHKTTGVFTITTGKMGKYITRIRLPLPGKPRWDKYLFDGVGIDSHFPHDKAIDAIVQEYQDTMQMEALVADEKAIPREALEDDNFFVGSAKCGLCHGAKYDKWRKTKHAHAMDTLVRVKRQFDPECVVCHSVGMKYETGYRSMAKTPKLANVGCEMCHGPGGLHADNPSKKNIYKKGNFKNCLDCHNHETSPAFEKNRKKYIRKIKHW